MGERRIRKAQIAMSRGWEWEVGERSHISGRVAEGARSRRVVSVSAGLKTCRANRQL